MPTLDITVSQPFNCFAQNRYRDATMFGDLKLKSTAVQNEVGNG